MNLPSTGSTTTAVGDSAATAPNLLREVDARGVLTLRLNRPEAFNALNEALLSELQAALDAAAQDKTIRAVVLAAEGKAFCAGHDLRQMLDHAQTDPQGPEHYHQMLFAACSALMLRIQSLPQPVVARVHGVATAAGCQLVSMCDLAVCSENARFAVSGIKLGLFCSTPAVGLARNMPRKQAMEMLLTGDFIDAQTALARGLVNRVYPLAELDTGLEHLLQNLLEKPAQALALGKQAFYQQIEQGIKAAYDVAGQAMADNLKQADTQEGVLAFVEKRAPRW